MRITAKAAAISAAVCLTFSAVPVTASADSSSTFVSEQKGYSLTCAVNPDGKTVTVAAAKVTTATEIKLPSKINDYTVSAIGSGAFAGCITAERMILPETVTTAGNGAFMSCTTLSYFSALGLTAVPEDCFFACPKLKEALFSDKLTAIGSEAFFGCTDLEMVIPASVTEIGANAIGMEAESHSGTISPVHDFLIFGKNGSCAESYAAENGIDFLDPDGFDRGDVDGNGFINASDASRVLSEYALLSTGSPASFSKKQNIIADMDGDGLINAKDASEILVVYSILSTT